MQLGGTRQLTCSRATSKELDAGELTSVHLRIRLRADWERLFGEADLLDVGFFGSWDSGRYDERADRMIAVGEV